MVKISHSGQLYCSTKKHPAH